MCQKMAKRYQVQWASNKRGIFWHFVLLIICDLWQFWLLCVFSQIHAAFTTNGRKVCVSYFILHITNAIILTYIVHDDINYFFTIYSSFFNFDNPELNKVIVKEIQNLYIEQKKQFSKPTNIVLANANGIPQEFLFN